MFIRYVYYMYTLINNMNKILTHGKLNIFWDIIDFYFLIVLKLNQTVKK